jgi:murein DD-endopeptidase MepM/ murein hydrolase activator NlpD
MNTMRFFLFVVGFGLSMGAAQAQKSHIDQTRDTWKPFYRDIKPSQPADNWKIPFTATNRSDPKGIKVISVFGAPRQSYLKGHIHTAIDCIPAKKADTVLVYPMAKGVVCSIHLDHPHQTIVVRHQMPDGSTVFTSYKHLKEIYVRTGMQVDQQTKLARLYTRPEALKYGGDYDHLHLEIRKSFDDYGCGSWLTMTQQELNQYYYDPAVFIKAHVGK